MVTLKRFREFTYLSVLPFVSFLLLNNYPFAVITAAHTSSGPVTVLATQITSSLILLGTAFPQLEALCHCPAVEMDSLQSQGGGGQRV